MIPLRQTLELAVQHHRAGNLPQAELLYRQVLQIEPHQADALHLLGVLQHQTGRYDAAVEQIHHALRLQPHWAEAHYNLGTALSEQGRLDEAVAAFQEALRLQPGLAGAHYNLGNALREQGKPAEAVAHYRQALRLQPGRADAYNNLGTALLDLGQAAEAEVCFREALRLNPQVGSGHTNLGNALRRQGKLEEGLAHLQRGVQLRPDSAEAHSSLAAALVDAGRAEEAEAEAREAVRLQPILVGAHNNLGAALLAQNRLEEARACFEQAVRLAPDLADTHTNHGNVLLGQGRPGEALADFEHALHLQPHYAAAHLNRAIVWLLLGEYERGWPEYEWRWQGEELQPRPFPQPLWDGSSLAGRTILLHAEQGLGDTLQFIRYAPLVKERGGTVLVECQPALGRLLSTCSGIDRLIAHGETLPDFDVHAPLLSLPGLIGTTLTTIPTKVPYLEAEPELVEQWRRELGLLDGLRVGIGWQGNPRNRADRRRSIPLRHFAPLAEVPGVRLVSLQKGPGVKQLHQVRFPVLDLGSRLDESSPFVDTAAVMKCLDLVITSDTVTAHLAGALGVPVWVALPFAPDWRWLLDRDDSPWYPTMRLFRQSGSGDWEGVFARLTQALRDRVEQDRPESPGTVGQG